MKSPDCCHCEQLAAKGFALVASKLALADFRGKSITGCKPKR
jgi:hypothetical protein